MDPQTLPVKGQEIYKKLAKEFSVGFEPLKIGNIRLNLLTVTDLEPLLNGKDPLKNPAEFPFWVKLWEASLVLAEFLAGQKFKKGCSLLDLGAGLGAPGLTASACGCSVTLTDYEERILNFQRVSAAASNLDSIQFEILDWLNPRNLGKFDIIIGAEILFREDFFKPLLNIMRESLQQNGTIYLAHDRKRKSLGPFLHLAEDEYNISVSQRKLKSLEEDKIIILNRLTPRI